MSAWVNVQGVTSRKRGTVMPESAGWRRAARVAAGSVLVGAALSAGTEVVAESYPSRPVKLIVPFPGGGPLDFTARLLADRFSAAIEQPLVLEDRPGGPRNFGTQGGGVAG